MNKTKIMGHKIDVQTFFKVDNSTMQMSIFNTDKIQIVISMKVIISF